MDHAGRMRHLQSVLQDQKLDSLLVTHLPNIHYLCGFTGSAAALLVQESGSVIFSDGRYRAQARAEVRAAKIVIAQKSPLTAAGEWLATARKRSNLSIGIEPESITAGWRGRLASILRGKARLRHAPPLIERMRMVKDVQEIARIRRAVELGARLFPIACENIRPGVKEVEVAAAMEYAARSSGAEGMSFPTIVASGKRSAVVHGRASETRIARRGFVVCDFGVILAGYCSDRTRTVHVGRPSNQALRFYDAVLEAQLAAIDAVRPGVTCAHIDAVARGVLRRHKLARFFTHSTGHGLGLEIHETPRLAAGQSQLLEPGMVVTIEPGAYVAESGGVRIEDVVAVTSSGCEVLTPASKELVVI